MKSCSTSKEALGTLWQLPSRASRRPQRASPCFRQAGLFLSMDSPCMVRIYSFICMAIILQVLPHKYISKWLREMMIMKREYSQGNWPLMNLKHICLLSATPFCYLYDDPAQLYYSFRAFYIRYWHRLHYISTHPQVTADKIIEYKKKRFKSTNFNLFNLILGYSFSVSSLWTVIRS